MQLVATCSSDLDNDGQMTSGSIIVSVTAGDLQWLTRSDIKLVPPRAIGFCQLFCYHCVSVLLHNWVHNKVCVHTARPTMSARQLRIAVAIILHTDSVSITADKDRMDKAGSIFCHLFRQKCVCTTFKGKWIFLINIRLTGLNFFSNRLVFFKYCWLLFP
jgi:hypothetical protein